MCPDFLNYTILDYGCFMKTLVVLLLIMNSFSCAGNAELYSKVGVPFVMGTTGGDRDLLNKTVEDAKLYAVISPQMGKQVSHNFGEPCSFFNFSFIYSCTLSTLCSILVSFR